MLLLLLVGIRNAWDNVTFLAVERDHSETAASKDVVLEEKGKSKR